MIGHHPRLRDVTSQSYPIDALLVLITRVIHRSKFYFVVAGRLKVSSIREQYHMKLVEKSRHLKRRGRKAFV